MAIISCDNEYSGRACIESPSSKGINAEAWMSLTATAQKVLLGDGFFPFMGISQYVYDRLPKEAQHLLSDNGYFIVEDVVGLSRFSFLWRRKFDDDIDDTIWEQMTIEAQASLLKNKILPQKGIRELEWEKLSSSMRCLLRNNGFYPVLSAAYKNDSSVLSFLSSTVTEFKFPDM